jgi:hypothetical protein
VAYHIVLRGRQIRFAGSQGKAGGEGAAWAEIIDAEQAYV